MKNVIDKYIKILRIEIDDLKDDLNFLATECHRKKESHEITNYVCQENIALIRNEILGIESFFEGLESFNPENYSKIEDYVHDVKANFKQVVHDRNLAEAVFYLIEKKMDKVVNYMNYDKS